MVQPAAHRAKKLFNDALEQPPDARQCFLDAACAGDRALHRQIERLLDAHNVVGDFLADPTRFNAGEALRLPPATPGTRIGRYTLRERIGEGGFGEVYRAEQREPVCRNVALKLVKPGMCTRRAIASFEAERRTLAMMDHRSIVKLLEAGTTEYGCPCFAMEYVRGAPITAHCDGERLGIDERVRLMVEVCEAMQYAHQRGIIHRDLKPSNILVEQVDGRTLPKIIDFGIAQTTAARLTDQVPRNEPDQLVGTPAYMSPEQVDTNGLRIDARTDVYSLGVVLYELLTGLLPHAPPNAHDRGSLRSGALVVKRVCIGSVHRCLPAAAMDMSRRRSRASQLHRGRHRAAAAHRWAYAAADAEG